MGETGEREVGWRKRSNKTRNCWGSSLDSQCLAPWCGTLDKSIFVWKRSEHISKGQVETKKSLELSHEQVQRESSGQWLTGMAMFPFLPGKVASPI